MANANLGGWTKTLPEFPLEDIFGHFGSCDQKIIIGWTWVEQRVEAQVVTIELVLTLFSLSVRDGFYCVITARLLQTGPAPVRFYLSDIIKLKLEP